MNFNNLATSKFNGKGNFKTPEAGVYHARVEKCEIKTAKSGNEYLSVRMSMTDKGLAKCGSCFDMLMDSDKPFLQYKVRRFLEAIGVPVAGEMSLKDLGVIAEGCELTLWVQQEEWNGQTRVVPNLRDAEGYYPADKFKDTYNIWAKMNDKPEIDMSFMNVPEGADDEELPFNDFHPTTETAASDDEF